MFDVKEIGCYVGDSIRGIVTGNSAKGVYVDLENGQPAFTIFGPLPRGTEVFCTVLEKPTERWLTLVAIDSVLRSNSDYYCYPKAA